MRNQDPARIAKVATALLQGIISIDSVTSFLNFSSLEDKSSFCHDLNALVHKCLLNQQDIIESVPLVTDLLKRHYRNVSSDETQEKIMHKLATISGEQTTYVATKDIADIGDLLTSSVLLASTLIDAARHPEKIFEQTNMNRLLGGILANTNTLVQNIIMSGFDATSASLGLFVGAGLTALKEDSYQKNNQLNEENLKNIIQKSEILFLDMHKTYATIAQHYRLVLDTLKQQSPVDMDRYQSKLEEWLHLENEFAKEIEQAQNAIAMASAITQQLQSQRRLGRVQDTLNTALIMAAISGPPGIIASSIIKSITSVGLILADSSITTSARLNHGIADNGLIIVTDAQSLKDAIARIPHAMDAVVAIAGPHLTPLVKFNINIEATIFDRSQLAKRLVSTMRDACSCSLGFSKSIPTVPAPLIFGAGENITTHHEQKTAIKNRLKELNTIQEELNKQAEFITFVAQELMAQKKPWPVVVNMDELLKVLNDTHQEIEKQAQSLRAQLGTAYLQQTPPPEGKKLLDRLDAHCKAFTDKRKQLDALHIQLGQTPHQLLFKQGIPVHLSHLSEEERQKIVTSYASRSQARSMWLSEIHFKLDTLEKLFSECEKLGRGHHLKNAREGLDEIEIQLLLLDKILKTANVSTQEIALYKDAVRKLQIVANKAVQIDKARIEYATENPHRLATAQSQYEDLSQFHQHLISYAENANEDALQINLHANVDTSQSLAVQLHQAERSLMPSVEKALMQPTPIHINIIDDTDAIISPDRTFFGFTKHQDMEKNVQEKVAALLSRQPHPEIVQVMPLKAINQNLILSCESDMSLLKNVIEGLKTEIQWMSRLKDALGVKGVSIANLDNVITYYHQQITCLEALSKGNCFKLDEHSEPTSKVEAIHNFKRKLHIAYHEKSVVEELNRANLALENLRQPPPSPALTLSALL